MVECLPSKQVVAGSSPVSRSTKPDATTCLPPKSLPAQLARYRLDARSRGYSKGTITHAGAGPKMIGHIDLLVGSSMCSMLEILREK